MMKQGIQQAGIGCMLLLLVGGSPFAIAVGADSTLSASVIKAHMAFLADDLLEGREAGTVGEALAARYIASQFEALGLTPAGEAGGFMQTVPLRAASLSSPDPSADFEFVIDTRQSSIRFDNGGDVAVYGSMQSEVVSVEADLVFAGHGITAPELGIDDYADLDVDGKVVAVLGGPPGFLPAAEAAHFGSTAQQRLTAAAHGAIGVVVIWTDALEQRFAFDRLKTVLGDERLTWVSPDGNANIEAPDIRLRALVRGAAAEALFAGTHTTAAEVIHQGISGVVKGVALNSRIRLLLHTAHNEASRSANVAALLKGSDPELADEVVVLTAHYDHVGICAPEAVDKICNGALDNALGVALMLDVARVLSTQTTAPARSILFLAVGAEEKGLLGSDYFATFPTVAAEAIIANINLDGGLPYFDFSDVIAFGAEQSQMGERLEAAVAELGLVVTPDPFPGQGIFVRSDQYSFVKRGIPALFLYNGFHDQKGVNRGKALWNEASIKHYHQPSDDLSLPIDYQVSAKYADVFRRVTLAVANTASRPLWYSDSVFGERFASEAEKAQRLD